MSDHVKGRLSAYLDREMPSADRQDVEAHLEQCDECARHLEDLALVDEMARALPLEVPVGYFEALPARVRFKVTPRRRVPKLPVWAWAVAAALLVAVVTPALLRQNPKLLEMAPAVAPAPATAPPARAAELREAPARPQPTADAPAEPGPTTGAARDELQSLPKKVPLAPPTPQVWAAPPETPAAAPAVGQAQGGLARNAAPLPLAKAEEAKAKDDKAREAPAEDRARATSPQASGATLAAAPEASSPEGAAGQHLYEPPVERDDADSVAAPRLESKKTEPARKSAGKLRFRVLAAEVPGTAEDARRLREDWRSFVAQGPPAAQADEGRVRMVELGARAWRFSNDPADLILVKRDAFAYLRRDDAAQGDRVRALLATLGN